MIKDYSTYMVNETAISSTKFKLKEFIGNHKNLAAAERALQDMIEGQLCRWCTKGLAHVKKEVIERATLATNLYGGMNYYFNGFSVDDSYEVEVFLKNNEVELVGFPSGEVLFVTPGQSQTLLDTNLIKFEKWIRWKDIDYKNIYFFKDQDYHEIKKMLDINYKKPVKKNIEKQKEYKTGDNVVCKGEIYFQNKHIQLQDRVGRVTSKMKSGNETYYNVKFYVDFIDIGNEFWMPASNVAGLYTGDIETQKALALLQKHRDMEEHEIDDDYHLGQLYKKEPKASESQVIKIGDEVVLSEKKLALYQISIEEFVDVWFKPGHILGEVLDIADIKGHPCVKVSKTKAWYKMSCVEK